MGGTTQKRFFYKPHVNERHNIYIYLHYTFCILSFIPSLDPHGKLPAKFILKSMKASSFLSTIVPLARTEACIYLGL